MKKILLLSTLFFNLQLQAQWQAYEPALTDVVGTYDLRIATGDDNVAWAVCMKYQVSANVYGWIPIDSLLFTKTSDGGETWQGGTIPMGVEPYASNICPIDATTAWASGLDEDFSSYVLRTSDGGETWERFLEDRFQAATSYVDFVHFFDEMNGIVMGDPAESATEPVPFFEIYTTTDGGQNWARIPSADIAPALPNEFGYGGRYFAVGDTLWFSTINITNNQNMRLYRSTDRGLTWTASDTNATDFFSFADGQYGIGARSVSSAQVGLRLTSDGGETWTDLPALNMGRMSSLAMVPDSRFILATMRTNNINGPFKTILSTDLGQTWTEIGNGMQHAGNAKFASMTLGYAGEWQPANHPTRMYKYAGDPLSGLLSGSALDAEVSVFPNPASDFVLVNANTPQPTVFLLLVNDAQGRLVERQVFQKTESLAASIDLQALPAGVYTVTLSTESGMTARKIVKQ